MSQISNPVGKVNFNLLNGNINKVKYGVALEQKAKKSARLNTILKGYQSIWGSRHIQEED